MAQKIVVTESHKQALAAGRNEGRIVRGYLRHVEQQGSRKRGPKRTTTTIEKRLAFIEETLPTSESLERVLLIQEQIDLQAELDHMGGSTPLSDDLEEGFVKICAAYSRRKGISYAAWRGAGVPADVLKRAGMTRYS